MAQRRPQRGKGQGINKGPKRGYEKPAPRPLDPPKEILEPGLYVIATPIGNLGDITFRAVETLKSVDALATEDTRVTAKLLNHIQVEKPHPTFSCHEHNEESTIHRVESLIAEGRAVGLVSDAGMPGVSDPGYRLISALVDGGHKVEVIPGANAATMALVASGLSMASFTFLGFPSRKSGKRQKMFEAERTTGHTLIMYESPHRIGKLLADAFDVLGNRRAVVSLELTKKFERFHRGTLGDLAEEFADVKQKGEITLVIEGLARKAKRAEAKDEAEAED